MKFKPKAPPSDRKAEVTPPSIPQCKCKPKLTALVKMFDPTDAAIENTLETLEKFRFKEINFEFGVEVRGQANENMEK